jgi:hypothetical protein
MVLLIRPILFAFMKSDAVKKLICDLVEGYAKTTDNTVDDQVAAMIRKGLAPAPVKADK